MKTKEPFNKKNCAYVHKVAAGDTLYKIARRYGVDYGRLMALNGITNPYQLKTGMEICIPPTLAPGEKTAPAFISSAKEIRSTAFHADSAFPWMISWPPTAISIPTICISA